MRDFFLRVGCHAQEKACTHSQKYFTCPGSISVTNSSSVTLA